MDGACRIVATGLALGLACGLGTAGASPPEGTEPAVYAKGLRARIEGTRLRPASLVFADTHVTVDLPGRDSERFGYDTIRFQRSRTPARWSLFHRTYWVTTLPGVPLFYALGPYSLAGFLGATHALEVSRWLSNRGGRHRLGLHSDDSHRCSQLALPRDAQLRRAILDEFAQRFVKDLRARFATGSRALSGARQAGAGLRACRPRWRASEPVATPRQRRAAELLGLMVRALPSGAATAAAAARAAFRRGPRRARGE